MEHICHCEKREVGNEFTSDQWARVDAIIAKYRGKPGSLIPALEEVQGVTGYLPYVVQRQVATGLGIPLAQVYGVVTFYSFFTMKPKGRHQIRVCLGTACHVRGSKRVIDNLEKDLGIEPGDCTEDREFSLDTVRCLGACGLAPVMVVDKDTHKQVKVAKLNAILNRYKNRAAGAKEVV